MGRYVWVACVGALMAMAAGCLKSTVRDGDAGPGRDDAGPGRDDAGVVDGGAADAAINCAPVSVDKLDLLFMVDNSNSMAEEQASLTAQFDRMVSLLASGDTDGDGNQDFPPVKDLNVGVVTSDMGTGGFRVPTCSEPNFGGDGVLRTVGNTTLAGCEAVYPKFLNYQPPATADAAGVVAFARQFACVATVGTGGCGFEQQLEASLKALMPSDCTADYCTFNGGTRGHGGAGGANEGFLRPDSVLAVILVTDEEDCSASNTELFNPSSAVFREDLNLRCFFHPDAVHPVSRYVEGFLALRDNPRSLVFAAIAGVPDELVADPSAINYDAILADPRMIEQVEVPDPSIQPPPPPRLTPSCNVPGRGIAFPPRRLVTVARDLEARGAGAVVQSICQADFTRVLDAIVARIADASTTPEACR